MTTSAELWSERVLLLAAFAAVAVVLMAYPIKADQRSLRTRLGPLNWDFTKSWAANLTVFSAALGVILAGTLLPATATASDKATFIVLNIVWGFAAVAGPVVYTVLQRRATVTLTEGDTTSEQAQYQGTVGGFLLGTVVTLWAVLGQFATVAELLAKIHGAHTLPAAPFAALAVVLIAAALLVIGFLATRINAIVSDQVHDPGGRRERFRAGLLRAGVGEDDLDAHAPELPPVPVL